MNDMGTPIPEPVNTIDGGVPVGCAAHGTAGYLPGG